VAPLPAPTLEFAGIRTNLQVMFSALAGRRRHLAMVLLVGAMLAHSSTSTSAQGLTGASVQGTVAQPSGLPVEHPLVTLVDISTGSIRRTTGNAKGGFLFENVSVGGPYRIEARSVGFEPASIEGISLHLGDRLVQQIVMNSQTAAVIDTVVVQAASLRDAGAGGPVYSIPGEAIRRLPLANRDFVGLLATVPQATVSQGALSISGQHSRFNAIQVDGASSEDFFGVNVTPGQSSGAKAISIEAIDEVRVLVAPFDVRQGWFSGGLINAVTRSGTNEVHGSVFSSLTRASLVGPDTAGARVPAFNSVQYGASLGGPIIRNRLHFFAVADVQSRRESFVGPATADPTTGISEATAERAASIFRDRYGFDAGDPNAPAIRQPNTNVFLKLSGQPSVNHLVELTQTWVDATTDILNRAVRNRNDRDGWQLSNSGYASRSRSVTSRGRLMSSAGDLSNELIASFGVIADGSQSNIRTPLFLVQGDLPNTFLAGGSVKGAQGTETRQRILEVTDNLSWSAGEHLFTLGSQNEFVHIRDNFFMGSWGVWTFGSVDALEIAQPLRYEVALPLRPGGPLADYSASLLSGYVQDRWSVASRLTLVGGLRVDAPYFQHPQQNLQLLTSPLGRIDTSVFPSGNRVLSPRVGFALELGRDRRAMLRGGVGAFTGRPLLAWLTGAYSNTGLEQTLLVCNPADGVPAPTTDIGQLPTRCLNAPPNRSAVPSITYFPRDFRFQQAIKYALGLDRDFGKGLLASIDVIHTRTRNHLIVDDVNLVDRGVDAEGRDMYGTITQTGVTRPTRIDSVNFGRVFRFENRTADRSTSVATVIRKQWSSTKQFQIGYNWSRTRDVTSLSNFNGLLMFQNNPIDGSISNRRLGRSARDIPHNLVATAMVPVALGVSAALYFRARSGTPYAPVANGDANADGTQSNDLAYIPRDSTDISLSNPAAYRALERYIEGEECLRSQRGRVLSRNSCRNPSVRTLDLRLGKSWTADRGRILEVTADAFNALNMLNHNWGLYRETSAREELPLLAVAGWDAVARRPLYTVPSINGTPTLPARNAVVPDASRWRMQLGASYTY
jgi:hypothetical protein